MLLLGWSHCYKNYKAVITIWLTVRKYPYLKWQWIFYLLHRCFLSSINAKTFIGLDCIYEWHGGCLIRSRTWLPFARTRVHFGGAVCVVPLFTFVCWVFCFVFILCLVYPMFPVYLHCQWLHSWNSRAWAQYEWNMVFFSISHLFLFYDIFKVSDLSYSFGQVHK